MSRENVEAVRRAYEAWNAGDPAAAIELLDPEVAWHLPPHFPDTQTFQGRDAVVAGLAGLAGAWEELRIEVHELLDAGERVVALVRFQGRAAISGLDLEGTSVDAQVWTLRDGRAVDVRMFSGTEEALQNPGLER